MAKRNRSPVVYSEDHIANRDVQLACIPLFLMAVYLYGTRPLLMGAVAIVTARLCDWLVSKLRRRPYDKGENSSVTAALVLTLMLPATMDLYVVVFGVAVAVLLAKHAFGGDGSYPFNPAAVGYAVIAVSWPGKLFIYPQPQQMLPLFSTEGVRMVAASAHTLKAGGLPTTSGMNLLLGNYAGPMGATFAVVIFACFVLLLVRRRVSWRVPVAFLSTAALVAFLFPRVSLVSRLVVLRYEMFSGAIIFAAVFLLAETTTLPKNKISQVIYGVLLGFVTMMFQYFGTFELGVCFAVILVNSVSGYIDRIVARIVGKKHMEVVLHAGE